MKSFTMNQDTMNRSTMHPLGAANELARDESGRLYSVRMRELFKDLHVDMSAVEALGALKIAGHMLGLLQERWAERHGLTQGRLGVLFRLYRCGDTPLGDLALNLDYTPRNITGLVDHLERDGLVQRVPDPSDRRSIRARLTEAGRVRIEAVWKEGVDHQFEMVEGFSKDDLAQLRHLCLQLVVNARKELGK
ncbi:MAG: MarR family transcriptional regulator [Chloroflexi bacterium]|nr:MAG: MarR family transcriptional regulator [Chloroflexota bacterium]